MNLGRGILGEMDGMATLTFCGGDPVNCMDPTGLEMWWEYTRRYWSAQTGQAKNYMNGNTHWMIAGTANSVLDVFGGMMAAPDALARTGSGSGNFAGKIDAYSGNAVNVSLLDVANAAPVVGSVGQNIGTSYAAVADNPNIETFAAATAATSEGILTALAPVQVKRGLMDGVQGKSPEKSLAPNNEPIVNFQQSPAGAASSGLRQTASSLPDLDFVKKIATKAETTGVRLGHGSAGTGSAQGVWKHGYAKRVLRRYKKMTGQKSNLLFEESYLGKTGASYGTAGSSRPDVFNPVTGEVFDYKFVKNPGRGLSSAQRARNAANVPGVTTQYEINP